MKLSVVREKDDSLIAYIETISEDNVCPICGAPGSKNGHGRTKVITHSLLTNQKCYIKWTPQRFLCSNAECKKSFTERNHFSFSGFSTSYATIQNIMFDLKNPHLSFKDVANKNDISITQVQRYFDSYVNAPRPILLPENIGIDEIRSDISKYGSAYLCVLVDNTKRELFDILPSRSKWELEKYFDLFPREERDKVKYVTIDMWKPYCDAAKIHFKNAHISVDPFHVIKNLVKAFDSLRISIMNQCIYNSTSYYLLKKWSWMFTAKDLNFDNERVFNSKFQRLMNRSDLMEAMLAISDELANAYYLLNLYQTFNSECPPEAAREQFEAVYEEFLSMDIPAYREFINLMNNWKEEIINSFERPTGRQQSNSLTENINSQIRSYLAVSKGSSNFERFRRRILYCLNNKIFYHCTNFLTWYIVEDS